jgi:predicted membrane channel-forming protein YqfA (hemolysin III family)
MKKFFKFLMLIILALAVFGTFYFLWNKSRPVEKLTISLNILFVC